MIQIEFKDEVTLIFTEHYDNINVWGRNISLSCRFHYLQVYVTTRDNYTYDSRTYVCFSDLPTIFNSYAENKINIKKDKKGFYLNGHYLPYRLNKEELKNTKLSLIFKGDVSTTEVVLI